MNNLELLRIVVDEITYKSPDEEINEDFIFELEEIRERLKYFLYKKVKEIILSSEKVSSQLVSYYFYNFDYWDDEEDNFKIIEKLMDLELQGKNSRFNDETNNALFLIDGSKK